MKNGKKIITLALFMLLIILSAIFTVDAHASRGDIKAVRDYARTIKGQVEVEVGIFINPKNIISTSRGFIAYRNESGRPVVRNYTDEEIASSGLKNNPGVDRVDPATTHNNEDEKLISSNGERDEIVGGETIKNATKVEFATAGAELKQWSDNIGSVADAPAKIADPKYTKWAKRIGVPKMMGNITTKYGQPIQEAANKYGLDWKVLLTIVMKESGGNPKAVSYCGAEGLTQLMPRTAKELGVKNSFNPKENIHGGAKYFSKMLKKFDGNLELALLAYNHGPATVNKLMEKEGENFNPRNYEYVKRVMHILGFEFENFEVV